MCEFLLRGGGGGVLLNGLRVNEGEDEFRVIASRDGEGEWHVLHLKGFDGEFGRRERRDQYFFARFVDSASLYV